MKVLIFGGNGLVGSRFAELAQARFDVVSPSLDEVDILKPDAVKSVIDREQPGAVINFAAFTNVEAAEEQLDKRDGSCYQINVIGAGHIAEACQKNKTYLIQISTDYVFDGQKDQPYTEADEPNPTNWYGETKYQGEQAVLETGVESAICRISMPYRVGYEVKKDIGRYFLEQLQQGNQIRAISDQWIKPTFVDDISHALKSMIERRLQGIIHVACTTQTTPFEFAKKIAQEFKLEGDLISEVTLEEYSKNKKARMPKYSVLDTLTFESLFPGVLHNLDESLASFKQAVDEQG